MTSSINSLNDLFRQLSQSGSSPGATGAGATGAAQFLQGPGQDLPPPPPLDGSSDAEPTKAPSAAASQLPSQKFSASVLQTLLSAQTTQSAQPSATDFANALIKGLDQNSDGSLSLSEVQQALKGLRSQTSQSSAGSSTSNDPLAQAFAALDTDGDGQLSAAELTAGLEKLAKDQSAAAALSPHRHHHHHPVEAAQQAEKPAAPSDASTAPTTATATSTAATASAASTSTGDIAANLVAAVTISSTAAAA